MPTSFRRIGGHNFDYHCDLVEVTSLHRPDTNWTFIDTHNHLHTWYDGDRPAEFYYRPSVKYTTPTLVWVKDGEEWIGDEFDGSMVAYGHHECKHCGDRVIPGYCADTTTQYMAGLKHYRIDGETVSEPEFNRRLTEAYDGEKGRGSGGQEAERGGPDKAE